MNKKIAFHILCSGILIVAFQNCSKTSFSSNSSDGTLQSLSGDGGDKNEVVLEQEGSVCSETRESYQDPSSKHASCAHMVNQCDDDAADELVACIIKDHGKSSKLGLVDGVLQEVTAASKSVCMTKAECLGDVAQSFNVLGAYDRGYCDHNPGVVRLSDSQVKMLLGI